MPNKKSVNEFVDKSTVHGMFRFDERGILKIGGVTAYMMPMASLVIHDYLSRKYLDNKKVNDIIYYTGKIQGIVAVKILRDKFGIKSKKEIFNTTVDQSRMVGLGKNEIIRFNEKDKHIIVRKLVVPYEETYIKIFGYQKESVGYFERGNLAGMLEELFGEKMIAIEKTCKAQGNSDCIEEAFPLESLRIRKLTEKEKDQIPKPEDQYPEIERLNKVLTYLK